MSELPPDEREFYRRTLEVLRENDVPFLVGGAFALARHTGVERQTKDLDLFVLCQDLGRAMKALEVAGYRTELAFSHWLAKAHHGKHFVDILFNSGNGVCAVNQTWFEHAMDDAVFGQPVRICAPEEMIYSKAFVMERERFDGADIAHLLRAKGKNLDWQRVLRHFGAHHPVLLSHLVLYQYIYPAQRDEVPAWVLRALMERTLDDIDAAETADETPVCRGTLLSRAQYLVDIQCFGYHDARAQPHGPMSRTEIDAWTDAIDRGH